MIKIYSTITHKNVYDKNKYGLENFKIKIDCFSLTSVFFIFSILFFKQKKFKYRTKIGSFPIENSYHFKTVKFAVRTYRMCR